MPSPSRSACVGCFSGSAGFSRVSPPFETSSFAGPAGLLAPSWAAAAPSSASVVGRCGATVPRVTVASPAVADGGDVTPLLRVG